MFDESSIAFDKNSSYFGEIQPEDALTSESSTFALYGELANKISLSFYTAWFPFRVGGNRTENLIETVGRLTLPDPSAYGKPVWPVTVKVGLHVLLRSDSKTFSETGFDP